MRCWRRATVPQCRVLWHITLHVDRQDFMYVTRQTYSHTHVHQYIHMCVCVCARILWCRCRFRLAQRNLFLAQLWSVGRQGRGGGGGRQSGTDRRSQSQPRRSRVELIRTSRHCQPSPQRKSALSYSVSFTHCQSLSLSAFLAFPFMAACAGIKCIPHEWIAEIRDGSQRVRCLTWIKAKSLAAPAPAPTPAPEVPPIPNSLCTLTPSIGGTPSLSFPHPISSSLHTSIQPAINAAGSRNVNVATSMSLSIRIEF